MESFDRMLVQVLKAKRLYFGPLAPENSGSRIAKVFCAAFFQKSGILP
jgi:hypothetical protein